MLCKRINTFFTSSKNETEIRVTHASVQGFLQGSTEFRFNGNVWIPPDSFYIVVSEGSRNAP